MLYNLIQFLKNPYRYIQHRRQVKKRLEELRNRDPFIYK
jgi:hypothetical protein